MEKTGGLIGISVFLLGVSASASQPEAEFLSGHAIIDGVPQTHVLNLTPQTMIVCRPRCVVKTPEGIVTINVEGFGAISQMRLFSDEASDSSMGLQAGEEQPRAGKGKAVQPAEGKAEPSVTPVSQASDKAKPAGIQVVQGDPSALRNVKVPYPVQQTLFLVQGSGKIFLLPQLRCSSKCHLSLRVDEGEKFAADFEKGDRPLVSFEVTQGSKGHARWTFVDGTTTSTGNFEVGVFSAENFSQGLRQKRPVEIIQ